METTTDIQINCSKHPTEKIQRVNPNINSESHVFCLECLLEDDQQQSPKDLLSVAEFLTIANDFYKNNQQKPVTELKVPSEYIAVFDEQSKVIEGLKEHILQEKQKIGQLFDQIKREFIESLEAQRRECLDELDKQLARLQYWHVFFEKRLRMTYPEITTKFNQTFTSSEESLIKTFETIKDPLQFEAYIRSIKEDLNEEVLKINKTKPFDQDRKLKLPSLYKRLAELQSAKPTYNVVIPKPSFPMRKSKAIFNIKTELQNNIKELLEKILVFETPIPDVLDDCNCPDSKVIESSQYPLLREWLPEEFRHQNLQLLYRGTRDGMSAVSFHKNCDYKGPTLTLIQCTFYLSSKKSIIGGFLDKDWTIDDKWIDSPQAFLFSLTAKVKCPFPAKARTQRAAYGNADYGPTFGGNHELTLNANFRENYVWPGEFEDSDLLIDRKNQQPLLSFDSQKSYGMNYFNIHEIEVYTFK